MLVAGAVRRTVVMLALSATFISLVQPPAEAHTRPTQRQLAQLINRARENHGRDRMKNADKLTHAARQHSKSMAKQQSLYHTTNLSKVVSWSWSGLAENVGVASTVEKAFKAFMNSPPHKDNILHKGWDRFGVGTARDPQGMLWVTVIFYAK
jgi:uncharacterized protein YkwD